MPSSAGRLLCCSAASVPAGHTFALPVRVATSGVIVTRQTGPVGEPTRHTFDLDPYAAVLPLLQRRIAGILTTPVLEARWHYSHIVGRVHTLYLLPPGPVHRRCDAAAAPDGGRACEAAHAGPAYPATGGHWFQRGHRAPRDTLHPATDDQPPCTGARLVDNRLNCWPRPPHCIRRISLLSSLCTCCAIRLAVGHGPGACTVLVQGVRPKSPATGAAHEAEEPACQQAFIATLRAWWQAAITADQGPHLVTFGPGAGGCCKRPYHDPPEPAALDFLWPTSGIPTSSSC